MKSSLEGLNDRFEQVEKRMRKYEDWSIKVMLAEEQEYKE